MCYVRNENKNISGIAGVEIRFYVAQILHHYTFARDIRWLTVWTTY